MAHLRAKKALREAHFSQGFFPQKKGFQIASATEQTFWFARQEKLLLFYVLVFPRLFAVAKKA